MAGEILAGLSAFKAMFDLAKGLKDINDATTRNAVAIELQEKILAAQAEQATLIERIRNLEEEVARFEAWDTEKQRYELYDIGRGNVARRLKKAKAPANQPMSFAQTVSSKAKNPFFRKKRGCRDVPMSVSAIIAKVKFI